MDEPEPPNSLPNYIADGLPKQGNDTLRDARDYIEELLERRSQPVDESELPDEAEPVNADRSGKGTVVQEYVKCGDESCRCMSGGEKHGPYLYRYYRADGKVRSEYVGKP